jgi:phospholipid-translocating ATPase
MVGAAAEGVLVWFLCWALYGGLSPVRDGGLFALGNLVFSVNVVWINLKLL